MCPENQPAKRVNHFQCLPVIEPGTIEAISREPAPVQGACARCQPLADQGASHVGTTRDSPSKLIFEGLDSQRYARISESFDSGHHPLAPIIF